VLSRAVVIATGVTIAGEREVLGVAIGDSEDGAFWAQFLRGLRERGMSGVQLAISDHHSGLKKAIAEVLIGAGWQRCRVHFARNALAKVPKGDTETIINAIRSIFAQGDAAHVVSQLHQVVSELDERFPAVAAMLVESEEELGVQDVPASTLAHDLVHQFARAVQSRNQATDPGRGCLSERRIGTASHHRRVPGHPRRLAIVGPTLLLRGVNAIPRGRPRAASQATRSPVVRDYECVSAASRSDTTRRDVIPTWPSSTVNSLNPPDERSNHYLRSCFVRAVSVVTHTWVHLDSPLISRLRLSPQQLCTVRAP
jgi:hypothetical protein